MRKYSITKKDHELSVLNELIVHLKHVQSSYWTVLLLISLWKVIIMLQHLSKSAKNERINQWTNATDYRQEDGKNLSPTFSIPIINLNFYMNADPGSTWVSNIPQSSVKLYTNLEKLISELAIHDVNH